MASKNTWKCEHGCKNTSVPCPHLEKLISPKRRQSRKRDVNILFTDTLEKFEKAIIPITTEEGFYNEIGELRDKLQGYILTLDEEEAIISRHGLSESFLELGAKLGCSKQRAWSIYKQAITKLKAQGYK